MAKKKKRKKKIRFFRVFLVLVVLTLLVLLVMFLGKIKVRGFYVSGNTYYDDQKILNITGLDKYPSFLLTNSYTVNSKIKGDKLINNIKIKKTLDGKFKVIVTDNKILFYDNNKNKSVITDGSYKKCLKKINLVDKDTLLNISEIKYEPNDIDKERFLLSMNDGNYVYVTMSKFSAINNYLEISTTLGEKNGILYLDYGNYFVPKE